jgi:integrase
MGKFIAEDFVSIEKAAKMMNLDHTALDNFIRGGLLADFVYEKGRDVFFKIKGKYFFLKSDIPKIIEIVRDNINKGHELYSDPDLINDAYVAKSGGISISQLHEMVNSGFWEDAVVGYFYTRKTGRKMIFFSKSKLSEERYQPISLINQNNGFSKAFLARWIRSIDEKHLKSICYKDTLFLDVEKLESLRDALRSEGYKRQVEKVSFSAFDFLSNEQQSEIEEYLDFRSTFELKGLGSSYPVIFDLEQHRRELSTAFMAFIFKRCGIPAHNIIEVIKNPDLLDPRFDNSKFNVTDIDASDIVFLKNNCGWMESTFFKRLTTVTPFLVYQWRKYKRTNKEIAEKFEDIVESLPKKKSTRSGEFDLGKLFLSREEVVAVYNFIKTSPNTKYKINNLRYATMWMLGFFAGVRPEEMILLRLKDFELNEDGFLKTDDEGWGMLWIAEERSKQKRCPSYEGYGNPLVPRLVELLNLYLSAFVYKYQSPGPDTDCFIFRPVPSKPDLAFKNSLDFMKRFRHEFYFLDDDKRRKLELKTSRRSANNLISTTLFSVENEDLRGDIQKWAAQIFMRHALTGTLGDRHYRMPITPEQYRRVLDLTLNHPWTIDGVKEWELMHGYRKHSDVQEDSITDKQVRERIAEIKSKLETKHNEEIARLTQELDQAKEQYNALKKQPDNMSVKEWLWQRKLCQQKISHLEEQLRNAK